MLKKLKNLLRFNTNNQMSDRNDAVQLMSPSARLRRAREIFSQNKEHARNLNVGIGREEKIDDNTSNMDIDYGLPSYSSSSSIIMKQRYGYNSNRALFESLNSNTNSMNELNIIKENDSSKTPSRLPIKINGLVNQLDEAWMASTSTSLSNQDNNYYQSSSSSSSSSNINMNDDDRYSVIVMLQNEVESLQKQLKDMENTVLQAHNDRDAALASVEDSKKDVIENNRKLVIENKELKEELEVANNKIITENSTLRSDLHESQSKLDKATRILSRLRFRQNHGISLHE